MRQALEHITISWAERILGLTTLDKIYLGVDSHSDINPFTQSLRAFEIRYTVAGLEHIPQSGPFIAISNHPTGGRDPLVLMDCLLGQRQDTLVIAHPWFDRYPAFRRHTILMDPRDKSSQGIKLNVKGLRAALEWLGKGGVIAIFPSGGVAHLHRNPRVVRDPAWLPGLEILVRKSGVSVLPVTLDGTNSMVYNAVSLLNPAWRIPLLARELLAKRGSSQSVCIHPLLRPDALQALSGGGMLVDRLQQLVEKGV